MPLATVKSTQTQEACNPDPLRDLDSAGWQVGLPPSFEPWELPRVHQLARHQASSTWSMLARALRHQHLTSAAPAAAAASAACQQRCALGGSAAAAHPTHSCILPSVGHASLQPPLLSSGCVQGWPGGAPAGGALVVSPALRLFHCNRPSVLTLAWPCCCCCRPEYADSVWELLASFFPNRQASPPICISISAGPHGRPAARRRLCSHPAAAAPGGAVALCCGSAGEQRQEALLPGGAASVWPCSGSRQPPHSITGHLACRPGRCSALFRCDGHAGHAAGAAGGTPPPGAGGPGGGAVDRQGPGFQVCGGAGGAAGGCGARWAGRQAELQAAQGRPRTAGRQAGRIAGGTGQEGRHRWQGSAHCIGQYRGCPCYLLVG